jgi:hypothetical protein
MIARYQHSVVLKHGSVLSVETSGYLGLLRLIKLCLLMITIIIISDKTSADAATLPTTTSTRRLSILQIPVTLSHFSQPVRHNFSQESPHFPFSHPRKLS